MEIKVYKSKNCLELWEKNQLIKSYVVAVGKNKDGHKQCEGDLRTPEGEYYVRIKNPNSSYHLSFSINYPNNQDALLGFQKKVISKTQYEAICKANNEGEVPLQNTPLGGEIYIHGELEKQDWSHGCVRLYNKDIEELYDKAYLGMKVCIYP